jgi:hypothetical protein
MSDLSVKLIASLNNSVNNIIKGAAMVVVQAVVMGTPVKTGNARGNWVTVLGDEEEWSQQPVSPGGEAPIARAATMIALRSEGQSVTCTNGVSYIMKLEDGSSQQAPYGMAKQAIAAGAAYVRSH